MIPKKIHYCWFGGNPIPEKMLEYMSTWQRFCPDYEIIRWDESNFDTDFCPYCNRAYKEKRYGFFTDAARLKIIYENGGIYLDTDVELVSSPDELLTHNAWFGYGTETEINTGSGFGARQGDPFVGVLLDSYLLKPQNDRFTVCTELDTEVFRQTFPEFLSDKTLRRDQILGDDILVLWNIWKYTSHHYTSTWQTPAQRFISEHEALKKSKELLKRIIKR